MKADKLINALNQIIAANGADASSVNVNFRSSYEDDVEAVLSVDEDLFDDDNRTLTDICLIGA